jgi:hypothetical protein
MVGTLKGHRDRVNSLAFDDEKKLLMSSGEDKTIRVWDLSKRKCVRILHSKNRANCVNFYDDKIISSLNGGQIEIWDLTTNTSHVIDAHESSINKFAICSKTNQFISCALNGTIKIWDKKTLSCQSTYQSEVPIFSILIHTFSEMIIACGNSNLIFLNFKLETIQEIPLSYNWITEIKLHTNGTLLAVSSIGEFYEWDINNFTLKYFTQLRFDDSNNYSSSMVAMDVNKRNGRIVFAKGRKILNCTFLALREPSVENNDPEVIKSITPSLNSIFSGFSELGYEQWHFNSDNKIFWRSIKNINLLALQKKLDSLGLVGKYETKEVTASDNKGIVIKMNTTFNFTDLAQLLSNIKNNQLLEHIKNNTVVRSPSH